jgi:hypothetical protein
MFVPRGYLEFRRAAALVPDCEDEWGSHDLKGERLGNALASGDLVAHGVVVGATRDGDFPELGSIRELRPAAWRMPGAREAVLGYRATGTLVQDDYILAPIIERTAFLSWRNAEFEKATNVSPEPQPPILRTQEPSYGVHPIPAGYVAFHQVHVTARVWAEGGLIDGELLPLLEPPDTDCFTEAVASGLLPVLGMNKRTGKVVHLTPSAWHNLVGGFPQSPWCLRSEIIVEGDGDPYLPLLAQSDLARALHAKTLPPDPAEPPAGWTPAVPVTAAAKLAHSAETLEAWMHGYAAGFKANGKTLKREEAIRAATQSLRCRTRQAEAAFAILPFPELRNPPRTAAGILAGTETPAAR